MKNQVNYVIFLFVCLDEEYYGFVAPDTILREA